LTGFGPFNRLSLKQHPFCRGPQMHLHPMRLIVMPLAPLFALTTLSFGWPTHVSGQELRPNASTTVAKQSAPGSTVHPSDPLVARVDGVEIHRSDIEAARQTMSPQGRRLPADQAFAVLRNHLVDIQLVLAAARRERLDESADFKRRLKDFADRMLEEAYINRILSKAPTEDELRARYQTYIKELPPQEEVHLRQILAPTEAEARVIIAKLNKGADFAKIADQYVKTHPGGGSGDLGYVRLNQMTPEFAKAAFALKVGQYSATPVKTEFGWHVIKVEGRRLAAPPSFEQARPELVKLDKNESVDRELEKLRRSAKIELFNLNGQLVPAAASPKSN
jgi:peptidyl-prolyl cis-trans isomerase C